MIGHKRPLENETQSPRPVKRIRLDEWLSDAGSESEFDSVASIPRSNSPPSPIPTTSVFSSTSLHSLPTPVERIKVFPSTKVRKSTESDRKLPKSLSGNEPQDPLNNKIQSFPGLGVSKQIVSALAAMSIRRPTEVQAACIPPLLAGSATYPPPVHIILPALGRDCIGNAKTGSGKTVAFAVPIIQKLSQDPYGIFALVLTPTRWVRVARRRWLWLLTLLLRELAFQIADQFAVLGAHLNVRTAVVVGGMDMMAQAIELERRPHVVVATPGRMVDHLRSTSGDWSLSRVRLLVCSFKAFRHRLPYVSLTGT